MKRLVSALAAAPAFALLACGIPALDRIVAERPGAAVPEGMRQIEGAGFPVAWVREDADFPSYDAVRLVHTEPRYLKPPRYASTDTVGLDNYALSDGFVSEMMTAMNESFEHEVAGATGFRPRGTQGARELTVRVSLIDLVVHAPLRRSGDETLTWVESIGELTIVIDCVDLETRRWLARFAERGALEPLSGRPIRATPESALYEARRLAELWARKLRRALEAPVPAEAS